MLEALARGKPHINRKLSEDAVTSCVFGSLTYVKAQNYARDIYGLFASLLPQIVPPGDRGAVQEMQLELWPKLGQPGNRRPEPDILIRFTDKFTNVLLTIMIEVKWGAGQFNYDKENGRFELSEQWAYLENSLREKAYHIYLVLDKFKAKEEIREMNNIHDNIFPYKGVSLRDWRKRFSVIGWSDYAKALQHHTFSELAGWANTVVSFLDKTGEVAVWQGCASAVNKGQFEYMAFRKPLLFDLGRKRFACPVYGSDVGEHPTSNLFWKKRKGFIAQINKLQFAETSISDSLFFIPGK